MLRVANEGKEKPCTTHEPSSKVFLGILRTVQLVESFPKYSGLLNTERLPRNSGVTSKPSRATKNDRNKSHVINVSHRKTQIVVLNHGLESGPLVALALAAMGNPAQHLVMFRRQSYQTWKSWAPEFPKKMSQTGNWSFYLCARFHSGAHALSCKHAYGSLALQFFAAKIRGACFHGEVGNVASFLFVARNKTLALLSLALSLSLFLSLSLVHMRTVAYAGMKCFLYKWYINICLVALLHMIPTCHASEYLLNSWVSLKS